jgi:hypothetical protein
LAATLRLTRKAAGIELWRGRFDVTVDGSSVGTLERQDTIETPVGPGPHTLILRMGRYSSQPHPFTAADDELITFRCHGAEGWPQLVASLIAPDLAIFIRPEED